MEKNIELQKLQLKDATLSTLIEFDSKTNILTMSGRTVPSNAYEFFIPVVAWAENFIKTKPKKIVLNISFQYLHTAAAKQVFGIIKLLKASEKDGNVLIVNWSYQNEDEDMKQVGMDFSAVLGMDFNYITLED